MKSKVTFKTLAVLAWVIIAAAVTVLPVFAAAENGGRPFSVSLSGAEEIPGPGDLDGSGTAFFTLNPGLGMVCYELTAENIDPAAAAHIHRAPAGMAGAVVVSLSPPTNGMSSGCAEVDMDLILDIIQHPEEYYVNVHNAAFPAGAIRGQLGR